MILLKSKKKLTKKQKEQIAEIRKEYAAKTADRDITMQDKVRKLPDRVPPEEIAEAKINLENQFRDEKASRSTLHIFFPNPPIRVPQIPKM